jgi:hypothetical protein
MLRQEERQQEERQQEEHRLEERRLEERPQTTLRRRTSKPAGPVSGQ